jgi:DNA-binding transcriptional ArsR family regulator
MNTPTVTELPRRREPVSRDTFLTGGDTMAPRKPHVRTTVEQTIAAVVELGGVASVAQVAEQLDVSPTSARRHLDAGVYRAQLVRDEHAPDGTSLTHTDWRYAVAPGEPVKP